MYTDRKFVRQLPVRVYFNEVELSEIETAVAISGLQRAEFLRDASLVIAKYISISGKDKNVRVCDLSFQLSVIASKQFIPTLP